MFLRTLVIKGSHFQANRKSQGCPSLKKKKKKTENHSVQYVLSAPWALHFKEFFIACRISDQLLIIDFYWNTV